MEQQQPAGGVDGSPVLTRAALVGQIQAHLDGRITLAQLAAWAFDQFYAYDMEELALEDDAEDTMLEALDTLMFADDPAFALDNAGLQALLTNLQP